MFYLNIQLTAIPHARGELAMVRMNAAVLQAGVQTAAIKVSTDISWSKKRCNNS